MNKNVMQYLFENLSGQKGYTVFLSISLRHWETNNTDLALL